MRCLNKLKQMVRKREIRKQLESEIYLFIGHLHKFRNWKKLFLSMEMIMISLNRSLKELKQEDKLDLRSLRWRKFRSIQTAMKSIYLKSLLESLLNGQIKKLIDWLKVLINMVKIMVNFINICMELKLKIRLCKSWTIWKKR